jgi:hypothetical protein
MDFGPAAAGRHVKLASLCFRLSWSIVWRFRARHRSCRRRAAALFRARHSLGLSLEGEAFVSVFAAIVAVFLDCDYNLNFYGFVTNTPALEWF